MVGNRGGQSLADRRLSAEVRSLGLKKLKAILEGEDNDYQKQIMLKLAASLLPRLNEHSGADGEKLVLQIVNYADTNSTPVQPTELPTGSIESETEIQDSSISSPRGEEQNSTERPDTEITTY